jgi:hypothetical protein
MGAAAVILRGADMPFQLLQQQTLLLLLLPSRLMSRLLTASEPSKVHVNHSFFTVFSLH